MNKIILFISCYFLTMLCFAQGTNNYIDLKNIQSWHLSSIPLKQPVLFLESSLQNDKAIGFNRAKTCWNTIDLIFYRNTSETPSNIDLLELSNHLIREIYKIEVYPDYQEQFEIPSFQTILNLDYYPNERGAYNFEVNSTNFSSGIDSSGFLKSPETRWGGIMRSINKNIFTTNDLNYLGFWLMDPFVYDTSSAGGNLYINIGNVSEDILKDGRKSYENGLPSTSIATNVDTTIWGRVSNLNITSNVFVNENYQDVGLDGLNNNDEHTFFQNYLDSIAFIFGTSSQVYQTALNDPSSDSYHYFRGSDYDAQSLSILGRYKNFNGLEGNSLPDSLSPELYSTAATTSPDNEDINLNNILDTAENYFQYKVILKRDSLIVGQNYITDKITVNPANGDGTPVTWYKFLIPLSSSQKEVIGNFNNLDSASFVRLFLKDFSNKLVLRFFELAFVTTDLSININEFQNDISAISIYPNPSKGELFIDNKNEIINYLKIYDLMGQEVYSIQLLNMNNPIVDISFLNNGMYVLIIDSNNKSHIKKLVIEK
jgi:cell surface protein SprA